MRCNSSISINDYGRYADAESDNGLACDCCGRALVHNFRGKRGTIPLFYLVLRQLLWVVEGTANKGIWHVKPIAKYWEYFVRCWAWLSHGA